MKWFAILVALCLAGCASTTPGAIAADQTASNNQLGQYQKSQPIPAFNYSQLRATLISIETAEAKSTQTTSFFYNMGSNVPILSCPSIGFPVPATDELTNPSQVVGESETDKWGGEQYVSGTVSLIDPTGVYSGNTTGTYVVCVNSSGEEYAVYWEGFVSAVSGAAVLKNGQITLVGVPTIKFPQPKLGS